MVDGQNYINGNLTEKQGILIYRDSDSLPQDVIFIPINKIDSLDINSLIEKGLKENKGIVPLMYFQGMRWRNSKLLDDISDGLAFNGVLYDKLIYNNLTKVRIIYGKIFFADTTSLTEKYDPVPTDKVTLKVNGESYLFEVHFEEPRDLGYPIIFERINYVYLNN